MSISQENMKITNMYAFTINKKCMKQKLPKLKEELDKL